jgi:hypothetical protein
MKELLFEVGLFPEATITAQLAPNAVSATQSHTVEATLVIDLHGHVVKRTATLQVAPNEQGLSVVSVEPILLTASEFGLESGVAALQRIAWSECDQPRNPRDGKPSVSAPIALNTR